MEPSRRGGLLPPQIVHPVTRTHAVSIGARTVLDFSAALLYTPPTVVEA